MTKRYRIPQKLEGDYWKHKDVQRIANDKRSGKWDDERCDEYLPSRSEDVITPRPQKHALPVGAARHQRFRSNIRFYRASASTEKRTDKQNGQLYTRPCRTYCFRRQLEAAWGTTHRYLPPIDEREKAPLARLVRTLTGRTRSKLPASQAHRLLVALAARKYNSFTPPPPPSRSLARSCFAFALISLRQ